MKKWITYVLNNSMHPSSSRRRASRRSALTFFALYDLLMGAKQECINELLPVFDFGGLLRFLSRISISVIQLTMLLF